MHETVIIGAGIAGITAAIYASRKRMDYIWISKDFGGQINVSGEIENYPGIKKTDGSGFGKKLQEQIEYNDIELKEGVKVKKVKKKGKNFVVVTDDEEYKTKTVILCTGARARKLGVPGEDELANKGLSYCAICDGPLFKDKEVAVVGGGDSALEAVDFLLKIAKKIYVLQKGPELTAQKYLVERIEKEEKVEILLNVDVKEILGDKKVEGIKYKQDGEEKNLKVEGVFVEIGRVPNTELVKELVEIDGHRHIKVNVRCETSVPGIFAAGDCTDIHEYQYIIAGGQGATALIKAARYLAGGQKNDKNNPKKK